MKKMKPDPYSIAEEYLRDGNFRIQKNALHALSIIGDERSIKKLTEVSLNHEKEKVKTEALNIIQNIDDPKKLRIVADQFQKVKLTGNLSIHNIPIYNKLIANNIKLDIGYPWNWIGHYKIISKSLYPDKKFFSNFKYLNTSFWCAILGVFIYYIVANLFTCDFCLHFLTSGEDAFQVLIIILISCIIVPIQTRHVIPIHYRLTTLSTLVADTWFILSGSFIIWILLGIITFLNEAESKEIYVFVSLVVLLVPLVVRLGNNLLFGFLSNRNYSRFIEIVGGGLLGIIFSSLLPFFFSKDNPSYEPILGLWTWCWPYVFALSGVFTSINHDKYKRNSILTKYVRTALLFFILMLAVLPFVKGVDSDRNKKDILLELKANTQFDEGQMDNSGQPNQNQQVFEYFKSVTSLDSFSYLIDLEQDNNILLMGTMDEVLGGGYSFIDFNTQYCLWNESVDSITMNLNFNENSTTENNTNSNDGLNISNPIDFNDGFIDINNVAIYFLNKGRYRIKFRQNLKYIESGIIWNQLCESRYLPRYDTPQGFFYIAVNQDQVDKNVYEELIKNYKNYSKYQIVTTLKGLGHTVITSNQ